MPEEEKDGATPVTQPEAEAPENGTAPQAEEAAQAPETEAPAQEPAQPEGTEKKAADAAALKTKAEQAEKALAEMKDRLLRTAAEYDNFRKRSAREHDAAYSDGVAGAVTALLPVLDTLELAARTETADENYKKGVLLTLDKSREAFEKLGVQEIEAQGLPFDPLLHEAVMQQPATEEVPAGTVAQVFLKGYTLHDKVVRHASVAVAE